MLCSRADGRWVFVVDRSTYFSQTSLVVCFCLKSQSHADNFERVGEADGDGAGQAATEESADGRLFVFGRNHDGADLLIGEKLDTGIGKDTEQSC